MNDGGDRLWGKVIPDGECLVFTGADNGHGYGAVKFRGRNMRAHQASYIWTYGGIAPGMYVLHQCDNRRCVRPDHLYEGTHADNMRDVREGGYLKGRATVWGEQVSTAILTEAQVEEMRKRYAEGSTTQRQLAADYGISQGTVSHITRGDGWVRATGPRTRFAKGKHPKGWGNPWMKDGDSGRTVAA